MCVCGVAACTMNLNLTMNFNKLSVVHVIRNYSWHDPVSDKCLRHGGSGYETRYEMLAFTGRKVAASRRSTGTIKPTLSTTS